MTNTYEVNWAMIYQADSPLDALSQAIADLETVVRTLHEGANLFCVRELDAEGTPLTVLEASALLDHEYAD